MKKSELENAYKKAPQNFHYAISSAIYKAQSKQNQKSKHHMKKPLKIALVCTLTVILGTSTVFAGTLLYSIFANQNGDYGVDFSIKPQTASSDWQYINVKCNYLPENMYRNEGENAYYKNVNGEIDVQYGFMLYAEKADKDFDFSTFYVKNYDSLVVNGNKAVLLNISYSDDSADMYSAYVYFENAGVLLEGSFYEKMPKDEIVKIIKGLEIEEGTMTECDFDFTLIDRNGFNSEYIPSVYNYNNEFKLGQTINARPEETASYFLHTVDSVEFFDNVSNLDERDFIEFNNIHINKADYIDSNGNVKPYIRKYYDFGDGVNTINKLIDTKTINRKFVLITETIENNSSDNQYFGLDFELRWLKNKNNTLIDADKTDQNLFGLWPYVFYREDYPESTLDVLMNPHEKITFKFGFFVDEDSLNELYYVVQTNANNNNGQFTYDYDYLKLDYQEKNNG